jgi:hypothetical protein
LGQAQQQQQALSQEIKDLTDQQRDIKLRLLQLRQQQRQQQLQQPAGLGPGLPASQQHVGGEGLLQRMGAGIDPVNAIFHPYTSQRGISLSAYEHVLPAAAQAGSAVPAAAVVEALEKLGSRLEQQVAALAAGGPAVAAGGTAHAAAAAGAAGSKQVQTDRGSAGGLAAAAAAAAAAGSDGGSSQGRHHSSSGVLAFPNFGQKSVRDAVKWYHDTPLASHLTGLEEEDCSGWTPKKMEDKGKVAWRGGSRGHRYQRWCEWVQLMKYVEAKQLQLCKERNRVVDVLEAAGVLDEQRGKLSLTKFFKEVVTASAAAQQSGDGEEVEGVAADSDGGACA